MDQVLKESGNSTIRAGSSTDRRMQQLQQNPVPRSNAPAQPPPLPPPQQGHKCPRCDSTNTKFCYYNNYSLSQPRYFCKACRRYWTQGGTLRNVPVGGGCRKGSKRAKTSTASSGATSSATASSRPQLPPGTVAPPIMSTNSSYYPSGGAGGFLSSLAAIQSSMGQPQLELGGGGPPSMNIGFFQGLGILPALSSQGQLFRGPPPPPSSSNNEWINTQGFLSNLHSTSDNPSHNMAAASADSTSFWSPNRAGGASNSSAAGDGDHGAVQGSPLNQNHWLGLPGYGPPQ